MYDGTPSPTPHPQLEILKYSLQSPCFNKSFDKDLTTSQGSPLHLTTDFIEILSGYYLPVRFLVSLLCLCFQMCTHKIRYPEMDTILWKNHSLLDTLFLLTEPKSHCGLTVNIPSNETPQVFFMLTLLNHNASIYNNTCF